MVTNKHESWQHDTASGWADQDVNNKPTGQSWHDPCHCALTAWSQGWVPSVFVWGYRAMLHRTGTGHICPDNRYLLLQKHSWFYVDHISPQTKCKMHRGFNYLCNVLPVLLYKNDCDIITTWHISFFFLQVYKPAGSTSYKWRINTPKW